MGYLLNSFLRDIERDRNKRRKEVRNQRAAQAMAVTLNRLIAGVRCPRCGQEACAAKYLVVPSKVPANAGVRLRDLPRGTPVPPTVVCTCPDGHQYHVSNGRLLPPVPGRRVR
jgi:hypothetical protein